MAIRVYKSWAKVPGQTAQKKWDKLVADHGDLASVECFKIILSDPEAFKYGDGRAYAVDDHEVGVLIAAKYFTTVRNVGRGVPKDRREFKTFAEAVADANNDPQVLVYGVVTEINSTSLAPKYWGFYAVILTALVARSI
jgi:hypothetical protein